MTAPTILARRTIELTAAAGPAAVGRLRADTVTRLDTWGLPAAVIENAQLIVSELLTNALRHTDATDLVLRLTIRADALRIEVDDPDHDNWPLLGPPSDDGESGNGMRIVDRLSHWGFVCGLGKTVFADIPLGGGQVRP